jgi:hypothetical protein
MGGIRERSKERGCRRPPELATTKFFIAWLERQKHCECCGIAFAIGRKSGVWRQDSSSVDRFDSNKGYELNNIALVCWRCNNIKRNYSADDLRQVASWIDRWGNQVDKFEAAA